MSRKDLAQCFLQRHALLRCPTCGADVAAAPGGVVCPQGHRVDLARKGTLSLCRAQGDPRYDKALFTARRALMQAGAFAPLFEAIAALLPAEPVTLGDIGCGEGALLAHLQQTRPGDVLLGVDLSAAAVEAASLYTGEDTLLLRGDLTALPLRDGTLDVLCNLLTPAAYGEFARVLRSGGLLIKAMPTPQHLRQLREALQVPFPRQDETTRLFAAHCPGAHCREITYTLPLDEALQQQLWAMTPLTYHRAPVRCPEMTFSFWLCSGVPQKEDPHA